MNDTPPPTNQQILGQLVVISGPSGAGKTTVLKTLIQQCPLPLELSVSATTRACRPGEIDGSSYHFLSTEEFQQKRQADEFLEFAEVFGRGYWYGTLREPVEQGLSQGNWIVLEIDVEGAGQVLQYYPDAILVFIHPGSLAELENRLRGRGTESPQALSRRLEVAQQELDAAHIYKHIVINQTVDQTATEICHLLQQAEN